MSRLLHRQIHAVPPRAVAARGMEIVDRSGKRYLDACGGAAVSCLGHAHPTVLSALHQQLDALPYAHTAFFSSEPAEKLADHLAQLAPGALSRVYLVSGGSEAVETAIKLARQYYWENGEPHRRHIIGRHQSFHGNTLGALAAGGNRWRRAPFEAMLGETHLIPPCYAYRYRISTESEAEYAARSAQALEDKILELGPETVMAFIAETVVGATAGAVPAVKGYWQRIREICDRYGVLLIMDEVMCGSGRTGTLYACEQEAVVPDLLTMAKGLGGGYQPVGAVLLSERLYQTIAEGSGSFQHGHTYLGHPMAAAAALAVQQVIQEENLLSNVVGMGERLDRQLRSRLENCSAVGDIRGRGLFRAIELVADPGSKTCFDPSLRVHARIKAEAMARGLLVYPAGGTVDGRRGDHVLLAPPFIAGPADIDEIVTRLGEAIEAALKFIGPG